MLWRQPLEDDLGPRRGQEMKCHATQKRQKKQRASDKCGIGWGTSFGFQYAKTLSKASSNELDSHETDANL